MIPSVYPSTVLKTDFRTAKEATTDAFALVTDGSRGTFLFGSEESLDEEIEASAWEEANAERIIAAIERGRAGIARGEYVVGADNAIALANQMRLERLQAACG